MEVVAQRLDHQRSYGVAVEGMTCAQLVEEFAPPIDRGYVVVLINGLLVPREYWERVTPKAHTTVIVAISAAGGGGGGKKSILSLVAMIAISVISMGAATALLAGTAYAGSATIAFGITYTQALASAIGFVANMAISHIFKPSQPKISGSSGSVSGAGASPTYSLQGQSNIMDAYGPVRRIFGQHRIYPVVVGRPIVEVYGDDQYLTTLYDIGAGDYDVADVRIGASHVSYFQNAQYVVHRNTQAPALAWYWGARHDDRFDLKLTPDWVMADTVTDAGWIIVSFLFPSGIATVNAETGATERGVVRFALEWSDFGVGNWQPVEAAYSWSASRPIMPDTSATAEVAATGELLRETHVGGDSGGDDLTRAGAAHIGDTRTYGIAVGTTQLALRSLGATMLAGARFNYNGTTYTVGDDVGPAYVVVNIAPPLQTEIVTQHQTYGGEEEGWVNQYLSLPTVLLYEQAGSYRVIDQRITQLALSVTIRPTAALPLGKRFSIRARQTEGFGDERTIYGDMALIGVTTISAEAVALRLRTPHTLLELRVKANDQVSGTLEELSCLVSSYLFVSRGGVWSYELSRSPAWALWEILTGKMNKRPLAASKLDVASFEAWATFCESTHPSTGAARCEFDHVVDYNTTIFALAQTVTAAGRATLTPGDGLFRVIVDSPKVAPVQVFTPHNSKGFKGVRTFIEAPHAFRAKFMNRATWKVEEVTVYNDGFSTANATIFEAIELPGVTRPGQVWCDARYRMAQGIHRQEQWTLDLDIENLVCTRGDLVHVAHDVPMLGGLPSRIKDVVYDGGGLATQWTLTEPLDLQGTPNLYGYTIRALNGAVHQGQFAAQLDAYTVAPQIPFAGVSVGDLHVWGELTRITYPFLVGAINPQPELAATLTLVPYAGAAIFGADTGAIPPYEPVVDHDLSNLAPPPIALVTVLQTLTYANRRPMLAVSFDWRSYVAPTMVSYEVWVNWSLNETGLPQLLGRSNAPHFEWLRDVDLSVMRSYPGSTFCVKVLGVNAFGSKRTLAETPATCDALMGDTTKPAAPPLFDLDLKRDTITLNWEHPAEPDVDFYEIRYTPLIAGASYAQSTILAPQIGYPTRSFDVPARLGTYFIKTVDTSGNRSDEFAAAFTPGENVWNLNVVALWDDEPEGWPGAKSEFVVRDGILETVAVADGEYRQRAEYYYDELYDGGAIYQTRFTSKIVAGGVSFNSVMARWVPLASADPIAGSVVLDSGDGSNIAELIDVWHELRWVTVENVMADWNPLASAVPIGLGAANFGAWRRFQVGDFIGQKFQFRLIAEYIGPDAVPDVGAAIAGAQIEIDMTDRIDGEFDVLCPVGGMRVLYDPPFKARPVLAITGDDVTAGDTHTITNQDHTGFDIEFFNGAASVARQFDWLAKGYGAQSVRIIEGLSRKGTRKPTSFVQTRRAA